MIFGISGTKRTVRIREVSVRRGQTVVFKYLGSSYFDFWHALCCIANLR